MSSFRFQRFFRISVLTGSQPRRVFVGGFTLLEVMVGMATFTLLALGITAGVLQSRRLSQLNVLRTSAYTVAQGYMEQIFSINPADLETASNPGNAGSRTAIPTEAVNSLTSNASLVEKSDPLYVSPITGNLPANMTWRTGTGLTGDAWNCKQILIDLATNGTGGNATPIVMNEYFDIQVSRAWTPVTTTTTTTNITTNVTTTTTSTVYQVPQSPTQPCYFLVKLDFQFQSPGYPTVGWLSGSLRMSRSDIAGP